MMSLPDFRPLPQTAVTVSQILTRNMKFHPESVFHATPFENRGRTVKLSSFPGLYAGVLKVP